MCYPEGFGHGRAAAEKINAAGKEKTGRRHGYNPGLAGVMAEELQEAARPIISNFTFAMLMTCVGIVVILFAIVFNVFR